MRFFAFAILLVSVAWAATLDITTSTSCPGNVLTVNAYTSDNSSPAGIELRLLLYDPYNGLKALLDTDANGTASANLSRTGYYRIYPSTIAYIHPDYVDFNYTAMCPPPGINLSISADCSRDILLINATSQGAPLADAFLSADSWSSLTSQSGRAAIPFQGEDYVFVSAQKQSLSPWSGWFGTGCG